MLDTFRPAIVRLDSGLLPAAPAELAADELGPSVYTSVPQTESALPYDGQTKTNRWLSRLRRPLALACQPVPPGFTAELAAAVAGPPE